MMHRTKETILKTDVSQVRKVENLHNRDGATEFLTEKKKPSGGK